MDKYEIAYNRVSCAAPCKKRWRFGIGEDVEQLAEGEPGGWMVPIMDKILGSTLGAWPTTMMDVAVLHPAGNQRMKVPGPTVTELADPWVMKYKGYVQLTGHLVVSCVADDGPDDAAPGRSYLYGAIWDSLFEESVDEEDEFEVGVSLLDLLWEDTLSFGPAGQFGSGGSKPAGVIVGPLPVPE